MMKKFKDKRPKLLSYETRPGELPWYLVEKLFKSGLIIDYHPMGRDIGSEYKEWWIYGKQPNYSEQAWVLVYKPRMREKVQAFLQTRRKFLEAAKEE